MRVLWLSNGAFTGTDPGGTGTWLAALGRALAASGEVELCNITWGDGPPARRDDGPIRQYIVPQQPPGRDGMPPERVVSAIVSAARDFSPDIVHVWGTEEPWGLLTARKLLEAPALLEIQGLKEPCARVYYGGLTSRELIACTSPREIARRTSIVSHRRAFEAWVPFEREIIAGHGLITIQSPWTEAWVRLQNTAAHCFYAADRALREPFYCAAPWSPADGAVVFCSAAYPAPYKGAHDALRAFAVLRARVPRARLRVAGPFDAHTARISGYVSWLHRLADTLGIAGSVEWLGPLSAERIVAQLQAAAAALIPSHCESYCMGLAEALYLGVPTVSAQTGGASLLMRGDESGLFYAAGDEVMCAYQLERVLTDGDLALRLSANARRDGVVRNDLGAIVRGQLETYRWVDDHASGG